MSSGAVRLRTERRRRGGGGGRGGRKCAFNNLSKRVWCRRSPTSLCSISFSGINVDDNRVVFLKDHLALHS